MASGSIYYKRVLPIQPKHFNVILQGLDYQTLQAYHMEFPDKNSNTIDASYFNRSNSPMHPFGVKTKRFKWQTEHEIDGNDIRGQMKDYSFECLNHSISWKDLMNKRPSLSPRKNIGSSKAFNTNIAGEINTRRTLTPNHDLLSSHYDFGKERKASVLKRNKSCGSFQFLMNKTPTQKKINIRIGVSKETGVFTKEYNTVNPIAKHRSFVDLKSPKILKGSAGKFRPQYLPKNYFDNDNPYNSRNIINLK